MKRHLLALGALLSLTAGVSAQQIGTVGAPPNVGTGILYAEIPSRPDGETVYILRGNRLVTAAKVLSSGKASGATISVPVDKAAVVQPGDIISLSPAADPAVAGMALAGGGGGDEMAGGGMTGGTPGGCPDQPLRLKPRGSDVQPYPRPAVEPLSSGGALGAYGQGLAAAAPVGTPYLRSPAFAGSPIIYMPQSVSRVLVPGITPYPHNIIPTSEYVYSSAPFMRTDVYVNLPYGTFYWPQGYAGTTPVEPQVPVYAVAPSTAMLTNQQSYAITRYDREMMEGNVAVPSVTSATPAPAPGLSAAAPPMAVPPGTSASAPPMAAPPVEAMPSLKPPAEAPPAPAAAPAPIVPTAPSAGEIVLDDMTPGTLQLEPPDGWQASVNVADSYEGASKFASAGGTPKKASFISNAPIQGEYELFMWWVPSNDQFRSSAVPVTINTASGPEKATLNQTDRTLLRTWVPVGKYNFKLGPNEKIVTVSTEGIQAGATVAVSVDALKLVKVR